MWKANKANKKIRLHRGYFAEGDVTPRSYRGKFAHMRL